MSDLDVVLITLIVEGIALLFVGAMIGRSIERGKWNQLIELGIIPAPDVQVKVACVTVRVYARCGKCGKLYPISCPCRTPDDGDYPIVMNDAVMREMCKHDVGDQLESGRISGQSSPCTHSDS